MDDDYCRMIHDRVDTCDNDSLSIVYSYQAKRCYQMIS